jgi:hypothetical protein
MHFEALDGCEAGRPLRDAASAHRTRRNFSKWNGSERLLSKPLARKFASIIQAT